MRKVLAVARREYSEIIRTRIFVINAICVPLMIVAVAWLSFRLTADESDLQSNLSIVIVNESSEIEPSLEGLEWNRLSGVGTIRVIDISNGGTGATSYEDATGIADSHGADVIVRLPPEIVERGAVQVQFRSSLSILQQVADSVETIVWEAVIDARLRRHGLHRQQVANTLRPLELEILALDGGAEAGAVSMANTLLPMFFMYMMFYVVTTMSHSLLGCVVEEKTSRVAEVLFAAISPSILMAGKLIGNLGVGFTLTLIWIVAAAWGASRWDLHGLVNISDAVLFAAYFLLGFAVLASVMIALGSVCNTSREAQSFSGIVTFVLLVPVILSPHLARHPDGGVACALSFFPPTSPMVMVTRLTSDQAAVPPWQVIGSGALLLLTAIGSIWGAARIYRVGMLMHGKRPQVAELWRWLRDP